jgi:hypothetical protein
MVFSPTKKCFEMELWDKVPSETAAAATAAASSSGGSNSGGNGGEAAAAAAAAVAALPRIVDVPASELPKFIKQAPWEEQWWDRDDEELLIHLHGAHLRVRERENKQTAVFFVFVTQPRMHIKLLNMRWDFFEVQPLL